MKGLWASRGAGKMAQELRAGTALTGDLTSVPSTHARWLTTVTTASNSSSEGPNTLFVL